ncbi:MAG: hypothetical protein NC078_09940 [Ruminococcus sp.]|nr:hypothetical protein [Ruminococcus sp.]
MRINQHMWEQFIKSRLKFNMMSRRTQRLTPRVIDTLEISDNTKQLLKDDYIEKTLNSGKPLTGVTYDEFRCYYNNMMRRKYHIYYYGSAEQWYKQALKGDIASLREREWRTNPEYSIPYRLFNAPEVVADRNAALEKYMNGEELSPWEIGIMHTLEGEEGAKILEKANNEANRNKVQKMLENALSEIGIEPSEEIELDIEAWGFSMKIGGNIGEENLKLLNEKLAEKAHSFDLLYYAYHTDECKKGGLPLDYCKLADKILDDYGGGSVYGISKDKEGNFTGLPEGLGEFIKENAIGEMGEEIPVRYKDRENDIKEARVMKVTFNSVIESIKNGSYKKLLKMTGKLTYKNGVLSC